MRQLSLPGIQKSSEQIVSILLTTFLILDAGWLLVDGTCVEEEGVHGAYSLDGVSVAMLASGGDQVW
jgi:hypothetical protein